MLKKTFLLLFLLMAVVLLIGVNKTDATVTSYKCSDFPGELADHYCAEFGPNRIRFLGTQNTTCGTKPCTIFFYQYDGQSLNCSLSRLVDVAIPLNLTKTLDSTAVHCDKYITDGTGDPLNFFWGKGFFDIGLCRITPDNGSTPPPSGNFYIVADLSYPDKKKPLNWAMRNGLSFYTAQIVGPASLASATAPVTPTSVTLTTKYATECSYAIDENGVLTLSKCPEGSAIYPLNNVKLCVPPLTEGEPTHDLSLWQCENIAYMPEGTIIGLTGSDPTIIVNGKLIRVP